MKPAYVDFMNEYIALGHMKPIDKHEFSTREPNFIPHHAVYKESSTTTKTRVVFDASCATSNKLSLNDILLVGPQLQCDLASTLLRWRKYRFAFTADVEKMYRQILVHPADQHFQCIMWRDSPQKPIVEYVLQTVTYGTSCAPHLAVRTLQQLAIDHQAEYPNASKVALEDFYVDDVMSGAYTSADCITLQQNLCALLLRGGLNLRKWASNHAPLLASIPADHREIQLPFNIDAHNTIKALGIAWNAADDVFQFELSLPPITLPASKRNVLSDISRLFDPLGWIAPSIIRAKMLMQKLWLKGVHWDDDLDDEITQHWQQLRSDLLNVNKIKIHRWMQYNNDHIELHGFCDASLHAYAAVVYSRIRQQDGTFHTSLLLSKTRVSPLKPVTIPKLELCGAVLLSQIISRVQADLKLPQPNIYAWTDSEIVLDWLRSQPHKWKTFIANRVATIQSLTKNSQWNHVPSADNPADCASRGMDVNQLSAFRLWWDGPLWLRSETTEWPQSKKKPANLQELQSYIAQTVDAPPMFNDDLINMLESFSSLNRLCRVTAFCSRFINNARPKHAKRRGPLSACEIHDALNIWITAVQHRHFEADIKKLQRNGPTANVSHLQSLRPFLDDDGLLRVGGRLQHSDLPTNEKHPNIMPDKSHLTTLLIR